ncbi:MAG: hypothetical protein K9M75_02335 [Phycisphaerae bacterium]|nr:hypothetical protein [Phycisphaerae bacterium]
MPLNNRGQSPIFAFVLTILITFVSSFLFPSSAGQSDCIELS